MTTPVYGTVRIWSKLFKAIGQSQSATIFYFTAHFHSGSGPINANKLSREYDRI